MQATVVTVQTVTQPGNKSYTHTIAIANDVARSSDELDRWRLFDVAGRRITYVDDIAKTYRTEPFESLLAARKRAMAQPLREGIPRATFTDGGVPPRVIAGVAARPATIRAGGYLRQLWIGAHPSLPDMLFSMMTASEAPSSTLAPMMQAVDARLTSVRGFPLAEHAELPFGNSKLVLDRTVTKIEQRSVPASLLQIPRDYRDVTPKPAPPRRRPSAR